jgi:aspartate-semialdehyde dehydrogenase
VGLVGWRGMVGSVLMDRMQAEGDFALIEPLFFTEKWRRQAWADSRFACETLEVRVVMSAAPAVVAP